MRREFHVRFCEGLGVRFPRATRRRVFVRSTRAGERTMKGLCRFLVQRLRLKVNEKKSAVDRARNRPFLGLVFRLNRNGSVDLQPSARSERRIRQRLRELIPRNAGRSLRWILERLNRYLRGWFGYFGICTGRTWRLLKTLDAHIRRRLRAYVVKQKKRPRYLYRFLIRCGVSCTAAYKTAYSRRGPWWQSNRPGLNLALPNVWFQSMLVSLENLWREKRRQISGAR